MIDPWLVLLLLKMAVAAGVVVGCSLIAERAGPLVAAMIATLPISVGPVYVFLALDHDAAFIAAAATGSMASNLGNCGLSLAYVLLAQRLRTFASLAPALAAWLCVVMTTRALAPSFAGLVLATPPLFLAAHLLVRPYLSARPAQASARLWYAIPLRAAAVALLAGTVTALSARVGPDWSGVLASLPIVLSSLIVILQPRIGGPASAAVIANGLLGLLGFGLAMAVVHLSAVALGSWPALGLGLVICILWNLGLTRLWRRATP